MEACVAREHRNKPVDGASPRHPTPYGPLKAIFAEKCNKMTERRTQIKSLGLQANHAKFADVKKTTQKEEKGKKKKGYKAAPVRWAQERKDAGHCTETK